MPQCKIRIPNSFYTDTQEVHVGRTCICMKCHVLRILIHFGMSKLRLKYTTELRTYHPYNTCTKHIYEFIFLSFCIALPILVVSSIYGRFPSLSPSHSIIYCSLWQKRNFWKLEVNLIVQTVLRSSLLALLDFELQHLFNRLGILRGSLLNGQIVKFTTGPSIIFPPVSPKHSTQWTIPIHFDHRRST